MLKFKVKNANDIIKVLNVATKITDKNVGNDILSKILFKKHENRLRIIASNTNTYVRFDIDAEFIEGDFILYDNKTLLTLLNLLSGEVEVDNGVIKNAKCKYKINYIEDADYPFINEEEFESITISFKELKEVANNVIYSTSKITGVLSGIYLNNNEIVATDGQRLTIGTINKNIGDIICPKFMITDLLRLPFEENIEIASCNNKIILKDKNIFVRLSSLAGNYPKYQAFLPKEIEKTIEIDSKEFHNALNLLVPVLDNNMLVKLNFDFENASISIEANNLNQEGSTNINIYDINGENIQNQEVKFNGQFLLDLLKTFEEKIYIVFYKDSIGISFTKDNLHHFIMPIVK